MNLLCIASNNLDKVSEIQSILGNLVQLITLKDINCFEELPETRPTLEGNSLQKAEFVFQKYKIACFADDTGLEVEALGGEPGVFSARYAGEHKNSDDNIDLLLNKLGTKINRRARFRTVITLLGLDDTPLYFEGVVEGTITNKRKGTFGFGYDSVFIPEGFKKTYAEMNLQEKSSLSHRAIAVKKLGEYLKDRIISR